MMNIFTNTSKYGRVWAEAFWGLRRRFESFWDYFFREPPGEHRLACARIP